MRLEEFIFNKKGGFPFKNAVLKIKSFLVASAIIICNIIISLEKFSVRVSTVSREILVVDYCNSLCQLLFSWLNIPPSLLSIYLSIQKQEIIPYRKISAWKPQYLFFSRLKCFHIFILFFIPPRRRDFKIFWVLILFWTSSDYWELFCNSLFSKRQKL